MKIDLNKINWRIKAFNKLSLNELYEIMHLRQRVFVVEQDCPYIDADFKDYKSIMVNGYYNQELVAHARLVSPGVSYQEASIGRVVSHPSTRGSGLGQELMEKSIAVLEENYDSKCRISAQTYLINFYSNFGFKVVSEEYLEDNLPHVQMFRT